MSFTLFRPLSEDVVRSSYMAGWQCFQAQGCRQSNLMTPKQVVVHAVECLGLCMEPVRRATLVGKAGRSLIPNRSECADYGYYRFFGRLVGSEMWRLPRRRLQPKPRNPFPYPRATKR